MSFSVLLIPSFFPLFLDTNSAISLVFPSFTKLQILLPFLLSCTFINPFRRSFGNSFTAAVNPSVVPSVLHYCTDLSLFCEQCFSSINSQGVLDPEPLMDSMDSSLDFRSNYPGSIFQPSHPDVERKFIHRKFIVFI